MSMAEDTRKRPDFSSDNSSSPASDPLAELARLIGQSDPFVDGARRGARKPLDSVKTDDRPAPEWLARPASSSDRDENDYGDEQPVARQYAAPPSHRADHYDEAAVTYEAQADHDYRPQAAPAPVAHDDRYAPQHAAPEPRAASAYQAEHDTAYQEADDAYQADDRYRVALPAGGYEPDSYYSDDGHIPPQGDDGVITGRRRGGIVTIAAVLGLAIIGTAGAFGYRAFTSGSGSSGSPPVIKADPTPAKTVPAPAAQASADSQSKPFQDRIGAAAAPERVVPREEQPVSLPVAPPTPRVTAPQPSAQAAAPLVSPPPPTSVNEPKRVRTLTIRPDASDTTASAAQPAAVVPPIAARPAATAAKQQSAGPMAINPSEPSSRTKTATRAPAPPAAAGGAYVVQVSAQRTEAEAQSSYQMLQAKYPTVLGGRNANFRRVDLGDKGGIFYRAQVGTFATSDQATTFCNSLKEAGGQCIVQRN